MEEDLCMLSSDDESRPPSPVVEIQGLPRSSPEADDGDTYSSGETSTPKRPVIKRRRVADSARHQCQISSSGLSDSIDELKTLVKTLCGKVDKNERCLKELQEAHARYEEAVDIFLITCLKYVGDNTTLHSSQITLQCKASFE